MTAQLSEAHQQMMALGASCDACPLATHKEAGGPVPSEILPGTDVIVVAQEPGKDEVRVGRPLCGRSGQYLDGALVGAGRHRSQVSSSNVVACRPPGGDIRAYEKRLSTKNKKRAKQGLPTLMFPTAACAPRLRRELEPFPHVIPMGSVAAYSLVPSMKGGILKRRGNLVQIHPQRLVDPNDPRIVPGRKLLPMLNPAFVTRYMQWDKVFVEDLRRAFRFFEGQLRWQEPTFIFRPTPDHLEDLILSGRYDYQWRGWRTHTYDVETTYDDPMINRLLCVGIGTPTWAVVVPLLWKDLEKTYYSPVDEQRIRDILVRWMKDPAILKTSWNGGSFDKQVMARHFDGIHPLPHLDQILIHRSVEPELPHDLGFVGSHWTDISAWKSDHKDNEAETEEEFFRYNALDVTVTAQVLEPLYAASEARNQIHVMLADHKIQEGCVGMHRTGQLIDQTERARQDIILRKDVTRWTERVRQVVHHADLDIADIVRRTKKLDAANLEKQITGLSEAEEEEGWEIPNLREFSLDTLAFNPLSHPQIRAVLFEEWKLPPPTNLKEKELMTGSGEISTGDAVLRCLVTDPRLTKLQRMFIHSIRMTRRWAKLWGTYIKPFRAWTAEDPGRVWSDGRVHPNWLSHVPVTGRISCNGPNMMNIPGSIKTMVIAGPGNRLTSADMNQLELRIVASLWNLTPYLEAFAQGIDSHQMTMRAIFGLERMMTYAGAPSAFGKKDFKKPSFFEKQRAVCKNIQYGSQYEAGLETVFRLVTSAEDKKTGRLEFPDLDLQEVAGMHANWLDGAGDIKAAWKATHAEAKMYGYLVEPVGGRRRDFAGRAKTGNEESNFKIQSSAAAIVNDIMSDLMDAIPFEKWGPNTGIVNQCHDSLTVEHPESETAWVAATMDEIMNRDVPALPGVRFTADVKTAPLTLWDPKADDGKGDWVKSDEGYSRWSDT